MRQVRDEQQRPAQRWAVKGLAASLGTGCAMARGGAPLQTSSGAAALWLRPSETPQDLLAGRLRSHGTVWPRAPGPGVSSRRDMPRARRGCNIQHQMLLSTHGPGPSQRRQIFPWLGALKWPHEDERGGIWSPVAGVRVNNASFPSCTARKHDTPGFLMKNKKR